MPEADNVQHNGRTQYIDILKAFSLLFLGVVFRHALEIPLGIHFTRVTCSRTAYDMRF
jgi:hypothetical protein